MISRPELEDNAAEIKGPDLFHGGYEFFPTQLTWYSGGYLVKELSGDVAFQRNEADRRVMLIFLHGIDIFMDEFYRGVLRVRHHL